MDIRCGCLRIGTVPIYRYDESIHDAQEDFFLLQKFFLFFFFNECFPYGHNEVAIGNAVFLGRILSGRYELVTLATVSCECERASEYIINPEKTTRKAKKKS